MGHWGSWSLWPSSSLSLWASTSEPISNLDYQAGPPTERGWWKSDWFDRNNLHINIYTGLPQNSQKNARTWKLEKLVSCTHHHHLNCTHPWNWCEKQIEVGRTLACHVRARQEASKLPEDQVRCWVWHRRWSQNLGREKHLYSILKIIQRIVKKLWLCDRIKYKRDLD